MITLITPPTPGKPIDKPAPKGRPNRLFMGGDDNKPVIPKIPKPRPGSVHMSEQDLNDYRKNKQGPSPTPPEKL